MLFDLRGRGRRRAIQAIYLTLALLMGGGLVLFGIGGETNGGLFDALGLTDGSNNSTSSGDVVEKAEKRAEARVRARPNDPLAMAALVRAEFQRAGQGEGYDQNNGVFTEQGKVKLREAERSWDRYLALEPPKPDADLAALMIQAFGPSGLSKLDKATAAAELVTEARPTSESFQQLAAMSYAAGQTRKGDLASEEAVAKADKADREALKATLASVKSQAQQVAAQQAAAEAGVNTTGAQLPGG